MPSSAGRLLPAAQDEHPQERTLIARRPLKGAASGPDLAVLAIFGPTASGKTAVAEAIAARIPGEIVSADSMQLYRGLPILTNQGAGRLVGIWPLDRQGTVAEYQLLAHAEVDGLLAEGRTPIVVGGSGLYFQAALVELSVPPMVLEADRAGWEELYDSVGAELAHRLLQERDARAAARVHPNDRRRVVRALELWQAGSTLVPAESRLWTDETRHPTTIVGLDVPPEALAERIRERTRGMFERGVVDEARAAVGVVPQVLGLEAARTLSRQEAEEEIITATRSLASYQRKWMRRIPGVVMVDASRPVDEVADAILEVARAR
ncbi:MAG: isopentenyl transferase family protein [Acidimicrobiia bacterium]